MVIVIMSPDIILSISYALCNIQYAICSILSDLKQIVFKPKYQDGYMMMP